MKRSIALTTALSLLLAGCATQRVPSPQISSVQVPSSFAYAPRTGTPGEVQRLIPLQDNAFLALYRSAIGNAPDLAIALARIEQARATADGARAERQPRIDGSAGINATRSSPSAANIPNGVAFDRTRLSYGGTISANWDADLFGRLKANQRAAAARLDAATAEAEAVRLALAADIAVRVIDWRTLMVREQTLREDLASAEELVRLAAVRAKAGVVAGFDVVRAEALAADARSRLAPLAGERATIAGQLATLTGTGTQSVLDALGTGQGDARLESAPSAAPSALLTARPDIAAVSARLTAADADVAAAAAQRFPKVTLSSALGLLAFALGDLFDTDAITGSLGAEIAGPILDFGRIEADIKGREAGVQEAFAQYRRVVFSALGESEAAFGVLAANDAESAALRKQVTIEQDATYLARVRYKNGLSDFLTVLDAQRSANAVRIRSAVADGQARRARVILWQALGGSEIPS
jgi:NodT family efflux transporter outer membrane factor (OMF) lipoprotein